MRSASLNFTPGRSSRSSQSTSTPACSERVVELARRGDERVVLCPMVTRCTWYGAMLIGQRMPLSSWCCSIVVATRRETPMP